MNKLIIQKYNLRVLNDNVHSPEHIMRINGKKKPSIKKIHSEQFQDTMGKSKVYKAKSIPQNTQIHD